MKVLLDKAIQRLGSGFGPESSNPVAPPKDEPKTSQSKLLATNSKVIDDRIEEKVEFTVDEVGEKLWRTRALLGPFKFDAPNPAEDKDRVRKLKVEMKSSAIYTG